MMHDRERIGWTREELRALQDAAGRPYEEVLRAEALSAGIYRLAAGETDPQAPHREDEVYVVLAGVAAIEVDGRETMVSAGSVVYVPKGLQHRFVHITEDLEVLVVFAPPESA